MVEIQEENFLRSRGSRTYGHGFCFFSCEACVVRSYPLWPGYYNGKDTVPGDWMQGDLLIRERILMEARKVTCRYQDSGEKAQWQPRDVENDSTNAWDRCKNPGTPAYGETRILQIRR